MSSTVRKTSHPLDPLDGSEIEATAELVRTARPELTRLRFVSIALREPPKEEFAAYEYGESLAREAEVVLLDASSERAYEAVVSLNLQRLISWKPLEGVQPAMIPEEYAELESIVKAHPDFVEAMRRRDIDDLSLVSLDPMTVGAWGDHHYLGRRLARAFTLLRSTPDGNPYARPVEGVVALIDLHRGEVLEVADYGAVPIPAGDGEFRASRMAELRSDLRPIEIVQPNGPSFTVDGNAVAWQKWSFRVGWTEREGLVLHTIGYRDGNRLRSILHRASFTELAVPYGDPSPGRYIHCPFDIGENLIGSAANSLELGCDCLGLIHYFDAWVSNGDGRAVKIANAICMHEEDYGILWKHYDSRTDHSEVRRSRRLVISFIATLGNYDYGFFWYLYQDGTIEVEVKATGIIQTAAIETGRTPNHGQLVAPGVNGMYHQHFFNARLDFDLDGRDNSIYEVHTETVPRGPDNPHGNAFQTVTRKLARESDGPCDIDPLAARQWLISNDNLRNSVGEHPAYKLIPGENVLPFAAEDSAFHRRAGFAYHHVWVTAYDSSERYAAGDYPNQHLGGAGLPAYVSQDRSLDNTDVVVWYSFGLHHIPRPEDWPVMPVAYIGFMLKPFGFFDRNPALDVPPAPHPHHCVPDHHQNPRGSN